ncbi:type III pantothenate kinase [Echinicola pacifica]|uniref:Type III pantothenate kinase n=1 Tax=Echinicola pacifica TaxID=346377 RepID=A0A918PR36_9BACT|nr:type III pantothenate kinase [Echinicola pacifica]GGZ18902.1 type III pantothenate kinase [Echinicola pacifica]
MRKFWGSLFFALLYIPYFRADFDLKETKPQGHKCDENNVNLPNFPVNNLVLDIGNTRVKAGLFASMVLKEEFSAKELGEVLDYIRQKDWQFAHAIVSSVRYDQEGLKEKLFFPFLYLDHDTPLPVDNCYESPRTLGLDRMAAAIGAVSNVLGNSPVLSIDLGTCITYDFVDGQSRYQGGSISPGLQMRYKAMHQQTARLPLIELESEGHLPDVLGKNTQDGMKSGVLQGVRFELEGLISYYQSQHQDLKVFICGGDSKFFESLTKDHIFVIPNLVLYGLNRILNYNVDKN